MKLEPRLSPSIFHTVSDKNLRRGKAGYEAIIYNIIRIHVYRTRMRAITADIVTACFSSNIIRSSATCTDGGQRGGKRRPLCGGRD